MGAGFFSDLLDAQFEWPQQGDRLVKPIDHPLDRRVAELDVSSQHLGVFSSGYKSAADTIVRSVERGELHANFVCWPALLLYRHALELALKDSIHWGARALEEDPGIKKSEHRLGVLLSRLCDQSAKLFPSENDVFLTAFGSLVRELDQIDPSGQAFRYPNDKDGKSFERGVSLLNLSDVKVAMDKALNFLCGYAGAASHYADITAEMNSEMYSDIGY